MIKWSFLLAVPLALIPVAPIGAIAQQPPPGPAQPSPAQPPPGQADPAAPEFTPQELEQILAPIALYPDDLLTQVLAASTYPLEIVMASRWTDQPGHKDLKGDTLVKALDTQDWDPSVKSLVPFPSVLKTMSDQLEWTQKLGDAFLAQEAAVLAAVQALRARAESAGTLQTNTQQIVTRESSTIIIQPAQPSTVYVPAYNPTVAYGAWPYPAYPPPYYPPPPGYYVGTALATGLAFGAGIAITGALWGWGSPNWGAGNVNVNVNRFNSINANSVNANRISNRTANSSTWKHNADHRRGVGYTNSQVRQQYRPNSAGNAASREAFRGRGTSGAQGLGQAGQRQAGAGNAQSRMANASRPNAGGVGGAQGRAANTQRPNAGGAGNAQGRFGNAGRANGAGGGRPQNAQRPNGGGAPAFRGVGNGAATRAQSAQGHASRAGVRSEWWRGPRRWWRSRRRWPWRRGPGRTPMMQLRSFRFWLGAVLLGCRCSRARCSRRHPSVEAPRHFVSADAAIDALVAAVRADDTAQLAPAVRASRPAGSGCGRSACQCRAARQIHRGL